MRSSITAMAVLAALACLPAAGLAQNASRPPAKVDPAAAAAGEEAAGAVDPAVLDRCREEAEAQKLREGPERKAFMGTCVTPED